MPFRSACPTDHCNVGQNLISKPSFVSYIFINFTLELSLACSDAYVLYSDQLIDLNFQVFPPPFHLISSFCLSLSYWSPARKETERKGNECLQQLDCQAAFLLSSFFTAPFQHVSAIRSVCRHNIKCRVYDQWDYCKLTLFLNSFCLFYLSAYCICVRQSTGQQRNRARHDSGGEEEETKGKCPWCGESSVTWQTAHVCHIFLVTDDSKMQSLLDQIT